MSQQTTTSAVPPRDLAATITARSVLRSGWAVALVYLGISAFAVIDLWIHRSYHPGVLTALLALAATVGALVALIRRPSAARGALYLAIGTVAGFIYDYGLLVADPDLNDSGTYLLNRVTIALLLVGAVGPRLISGVLWCTAGCAAGSLATATAQVSLGLQAKPGFGPIVSLATYLVIIAMFVLIRRSQRRFNPDFSAVEAETARMAGQRELEERAAALLHDTILNDLAVVANSRDKLDERARSRILRDIAAVSSAPEDLLRAKARVGQFRNDLLAVMSEFRWRGLTVDVSGGEALSHELNPASAAALVGAVSGCLENVVRHSGSKSAEVFLDANETNLSVMIVDHGTGFDPDSVPESRLGIRRALIQRIERLGGTVRIWSAVGSGTSVVITVPLDVADD